MKKDAAPATPTSLRQVTLSAYALLVCFRATTLKCDTDDDYVFSDDVRTALRPNAVAARAAMKALEDRKLDPIDEDWDDAVSRLEESRYTADLHETTLRWLRERVKRPELQDSGVWARSRRQMKKDLEG